ncbi:MAG: hypothetical protein ACFFC9_15385 [Promethearchaeota archaeon]
MAVPLRRQYWDGSLLILYGKDLYLNIVVTNIMKKGKDRII